MNEAHDVGRIDAGRFTGRVNRKLALIFGISLIGVLLLGGMSIFFARSIYVAAGEIRQEHKEIELANRIHSTFHHFLFALQRSVILSRPIPENVRSAYAEQLKELIAGEHDYHEESPEQKVVEEIRRKTSALLKLSAQLGLKQPDAEGRFSYQHFDELDHFASDLQVLIHSLIAAHQAQMDRLLAQNESSMRWIFVFYAVFFLVAALLVVGSSLYFGRTIARPLRSLSRAAEEVGGGKLQETAPVVSNDEIGLLNHTFNVMVNRLADSESKLRQLTILEERERIAAELHDSVAQSLALVNLKLAQLDAARGQENSGVSDAIITETRTIVGHTYNEVREAIFGLGAEMGAKRDFVAHLADFIRDFSAMKNIPTDLRVPDPGVIKLSPHAEVQLIRIIQEALTNVSKHARASRSVVSLEQEDNYVRVAIEDNGKGFLSQEVESNGVHFGLKTMRERARAAGGQLHIESALGKGTKIIVQLPRERAAPS